MKKKIMIACIVSIQSASVFASIPVVSTKNDTATAYVSKEDEVMVKNALESFKSLSKSERITKQIKLPKHLVMLA
jgi:hypothetical protein